MRDLPDDTGTGDAGPPGFRAVLEHVDAHLDGDLSATRLSRVAAVSRFHFHRRFAELHGIGAARYVRLLRLRRAAYTLAFRDRPILEVALESGYGSHEAFARAFKRAVGQTPSAFRARPEWRPWHGIERPLRDLRRIHMSPSYGPDSVAVIEFPETRVASIEHRGDPALVGDTVRTLIAWRRRNGLPPAVSATFNILHADPVATPPADFRLEICAATDRDVAANTDGVVERTIPGGRCAVLRHVGSDDGIGAAVRHLAAIWLPASGEERRAFPPFLMRVRFFPDVPEHEAITDVHLPLR